MESKELRIGRAGQHLVMVDLLMRGHKAFTTTEGCNYDIVVDLGYRLLRLQVKATQQPAYMNSEYKSPVYLFHVRRAGRGGKRLYQVGEFEGFALACLDNRAVWYYHFTDQINKTLILRVPGIKYKINAGKIAPYINEFTLERFLAHFES